jgi:hypothetical protein
VIYIVEENRTYDQVLGELLSQAPSSVLEKRLRAALARRKDEDRLILQLRKGRAT